MLIHFADEVLYDTVPVVARHLADGGNFYAIAKVGRRQEGGWQGFPVVWRSVEFYRDAGERVGLRMADVGCLRELGHVSGNESQDEQRMLRPVHA